jgi:hypothetical protein
MPKPVRPSDDEIAKRAYELYLQRGSSPGYEVDDWLQAEAELMAASARAPDESEDGRGAGADREPTTGRRGGGRRENASSSRRSLRQ